ncbi:MAG: tetratricopeptide repeat protein [Lachnospiraceae bacterium]|nr:tetratricopeptide repeat protein [Lachnospiraceae bacterium]
MKKIVATMICGLLMMQPCIPVFAVEAGQEAITDEAIIQSGLTMNDIQEAGRYYKAISESGEADSFETEYRFALAAAAMGSGDAMLWLGELYQGDKVEAAHEDNDAVATAVEWWTKAYENGQPRGYDNIGLLYQHQSVPGGGDAYGSIPLDNEKALSYFIDASDAGDTKAPRHAALCYLEGVGVEVNKEKAIEYFKLASERGDSTGTVYYADFLLTGDGVEQDVDAAIALYQGIVDTNGHDLGTCAYKLGVIYDEGNFTDADKDKAIEYYQLAIENGNQDAQNALDAM